MEKPTSNHHLKRDKPDSGEIILAFLLIFLGIVFLLNNFGWLDKSIWPQIWQLWPMLLILLGTSWLIGDSWLGRLLTLIISLVVFGGLLIYLLLNSRAPLPESWYNYLAMVNKNFNSTFFFFNQ